MQRTISQMQFAFAIRFQSHGLGIQRRNNIHPAQTAHRISTSNHRTSFFVFKPYSFNTSTVLKQRTSRIRLLCQPHPAAPNKPHLLLRLQCRQPQLVPYLNECLQWSNGAMVCVFSTQDPSVHGAALGFGETKFSQALSICTARRLAT